MFMKLKEVVLENKVKTTTKTNIDDVYNLFVFNYIYVLVFYGLYGHITPNKGGH